MIAAGTCELTQSQWYVNFLILKTKHNWQRQLRSMDSSTHMLTILFWTVPGVFELAPTLDGRTAAAASGSTISAGVLLCLPAFLHCNCMASCVYKFLFSGSLFLLSGPSPLRLFFPWIRFSSVFLNGRLRFLEFGKVKSFFFYLFCCCCCRRGRLSKLTSSTSFRATIDDNCVLVQWTQHGRYLSEWPQRFFVGHKFFFVAQLPTPMFSLQWWYHAVEEAHYRSLA